MALKRQREVQCFFFYGGDQYNSLTILVINLQMLRGSTHASVSDCVAIFKLIWIPETVDFIVSMNGFEVYGLIIRTSSLNQTLDF